MAVASEARELRLNVNVNPLEDFPAARKVGPERHAIVNQEPVMSAIKIHLDPAEHAAISRYATALHVNLEDIAYAALDQLMQRCNDATVRRDIVETRGWRENNLPQWADSERSVHVYESGRDSHPEERLHF